MALTANYGWPYPGEYEDPWYANFAAFAAAIDSAMLTRTDRITGRTYWDLDAGTYPERNANVTLAGNFNNPTGIYSNFYSVVQGNGDSPGNHFYGAAAGLFLALDRSDVTSSNKGVLYGIGISVQPRVTRGLNVPYDDVAGLVVGNDGTAKGTDGIAVPPGINHLASEWVQAIGIGCNADYAIRAIGTYEYIGIDISQATINGDHAIAVGNSKGISGICTDNVTFKIMAMIDANNKLSLYNNTVIIDGTGIVNASGFVLPNDLSLASKTTGGTAVALIYIDTNNEIGLYNDLIKIDNTGGINLYGSAPGNGARIYPSNNTDCIIRSGTVGSYKYFQCLTNGNLQIDETLVARALNLNSQAVTVGGPDTGDLGYRCLQVPN